MRAAVSQLILDFEIPVGKRDDDEGDLVDLRVLHSEQEYFDAKRVAAPQYKVTLPRPFRETALVDDTGWRHRPRPAWAAKDLGARMWRNLPDSIRNSILNGTPSSPQRVAVLSTRCGMDDIPWEWVTDGEQPIAAMDSVRFIRLVPARYASPLLKVSLPIRVLIVVTNPKEDRLLLPEVEIDVITQGLRENAAYKFDVLMEPRFEKLKECLENFSPNILHYVGHSGVSGSMGNLILHDEGTGTRWISPAELSRVLPASVRLLCLSTCVTRENYHVGGLSKFAHATPETQLPTTITNQYALHESNARLFWQRFYPALVEFNGNSVEALHSARLALFAQHEDSWCWASFSIVVRDGSGHSLQIADSIPKSEEQYSKELQAQWSARLANNLATRMLSLSEDVQKHWQPTLDDEVARTESLENELSNE